MSDRTERRDAAHAEEVDELEEVVVEAVFAEEEEDENGKVEAAVEADLEIEDQAAVEEAEVLDVLLRRSGVLPEQTDVGALDEETELPATRRDGEFVCSSCFLIKPASQMGDADHRICRDCIDPPPAKHVA
jgi:hypothetical protein